LWPQLASHNVISGILNRVHAAAAGSVSPGAMWARVVREMLKQCAYGASAQHTKGAPLLGYIGEIAVARQGKLQLRLYPAYSFLSLAALLSMICARSTWMDAGESMHVFRFVLILASVLYAGCRRLVHARASSAGKQVTLVLFVWLELCHLLISALCNY
jgi:hypothetical protein